MTIKGEIYMKKMLSDYKLENSGINKVLGSLESSIMDIIWNKDHEVCIRDVYEELASKRKIAYTTVMTIMVRLADKKMLLKRKEGNTFFFKPAMTKKEFTENFVGNVVDSLLEDFADTTMAHIITKLKKNAMNSIGTLEKLLEDYKKGNSK